MMDLSQSDRVICFGRVINVDIYYYDKSHKENKAVSIMTPKTGLKPDISVSLNVLPSNNITALTVTIRNMLVDFDISKAYYMTVAMGYETCGVAVYESIIFRSYQATPNPDGEFVFEGVVTGDSTGYQNDISIVESDPYDIVWNDLGKTPVYSFVETVLNGNQSRKPKFMFEIVYDVDDSLKSRLKQEMMSVQKNHSGFLTPLSRATYAKQVLTNYAETHDIPITVLIDGNRFIIKSMSQDSNESPDKSIDIIGYTSASFNGALLNINMPYYPAINAGSLLRCDASFVKQTGPPNDNGNDQMRNDAWSLYRVMRYSIQFSTTRENTMSIDAFPIKEAGKVSADAGADNYDEVNLRARRMRTAGSYLQEILDYEYSNKDNEGKIRLGDINADINVVTAMRHNYAKSFASDGTYYAYNGIASKIEVDSSYQKAYVKSISIVKPFTILDAIKMHKEYKDNIALMVPADNYYGPIQQFDIDIFFPVIFAATWYRRRTEGPSSGFCDCPPYSPIGFSSGYMWFPSVSTLGTSWNQLSGILQDFIKIYENQRAYSRYVNAWKFLVENAEGLTIVSRETWFNPGE